MEESDFRVVAIGTWLYDGQVPREVTLVRRPAQLAVSRWDEGALDPTPAVPETPDGYVYSVGATRGGDFTTAAAAKAWADRQPWGPVTWRDADEPATVMIVDDD